jgi:2-oxoglutarate ferredoxin oxidoreductase subunit beta
VTAVQTEGNINTPFNPVLMAIASGAGFVARAFSGDPAHLVSIMKQAISYEGYAIVDILQPCVSFNKVNTFAYYKSRVYHLDQEYDSSNKLLAMEKAMEFDSKIPIGVIYQEEKSNYHQKHVVLSSREPLLDKKVDMEAVQKLVSEFV